MFFFLSVNPIMPLGRDNYLSTLEFLKGVSKSTQGCLFVWGFLFHHLVEMICLLSPVDLLLSSSAAHYCSHKAARSGERQAGREEGRRVGVGESSLYRLAYSGALPSIDVWYSNPSYTHQAVINQQMLSEVNIILIAITAIEMTVFLHFCFMDAVIAVRQRQDEWQRTTYYISLKSIVCLKQNCPWTLVCENSIEVNGVISKKALVSQAKSSEHLILTQRTKTLRLQMRNICLISWFFLHWWCNICINIWLLTEVSSKTQFLIKLASIYENAMQLHDILWLRSP